MFISPWYMPLLMVIAGISARYSLVKRSASEFVKERLQKLFLPLIAGAVTEVAVVTYFADRFFCDYQGSFFEHYGIFFTRICSLVWKFDNDYDIIKKYKRWICAVCML